MNEVLEYKETTYSLSDGIHSFVFLDVRKKLRSWDVHEGKPIEVWNEVFEIIG